MFVQYFEYIRKVYNGEKYKLNNRNYVETTFFSDFFYYITVSLSKWTLLVAQDCHALQTRYSINKDLLKPLLSLLSKLNFLIMVR